LSYISLIVIFEKQYQNDLIIYIYIKNKTNNIREYICKQKSAIRRLWTYCNELRPLNRQ